MPHPLERLMMEHTRQPGQEDLPPPFLRPGRHVLRRLRQGGLREFVQGVLRDVLRAARRVILPQAKGGDAAKVALGVLLALLWTAAACGAQTGPLRVGVLVDCPPLAFSVGSYPHRNMRGLAVELATMLNSSLRRETVFREGDLNDLRVWLKNGSIDYVCGLPMASAHTMGTASLMVTNFALTRRILVHDTNMHISSEEDFKRRTIAFLERDMYHTRLNVPKMRKAFMGTYREGLRALSRGEVDAFIPPCSEIATYISQREEQSPAITMGMSLERIPLLLVFPPGSRLQAPVSEALSRHESNGALDGLRNTWLGRTLYHEPSLWEKHQKTIVYGIGILAALAAFTLAWTVALRREVARVTRRLRYTEQSYQTLFDASPDMVFMLDRRGDVTLANKAARSLFLPTMPGAGDTLFPLLEAKDQTRLQTLIDLTAEGGARQEELTLHPASGPGLTVELNAFSSRDSQTGAPVVCCIARDLTERLKMEKELLAAERLAVIGNMAAGIAHEVNNPLNVILTNAELLEDMADDADMIPCIRAILHNVERAAGIIRQLLDLSTPARMETAPLNLSAIARDCLAFLKPRLKNVRVDVAGLPDTLAVRGDRQQLEQLLLNLILNALAGMKDRGTLNLSGRQDHAARSSVRLEVRDDGRGIPRENLEKIFDLFFTTRNREGFGLGLFLSRRIAERHGGLLFAESEEGHGATFILELPADQGDR